MFYALNKKYTTSSQNTTKFIAILYNMLHNYMFRPFFRPSSGCIRLALRVMYPDDKVYYFDDHQSSILCHQGTLLSRLSGYNLKKGRNM